MSYSEVSVPANFVVDTDCVVNATVLWLILVSLEAVVGSVEEVA